MDTTQLNYTLLQLAIMQIQMYYKEVSKTMVVELHLMKIQILFGICLLTEMDHTQELLTMKKIFI